VHEDRQTRSEKWSAQEPTERARIFYDCFLSSSERAPSRASPSQVQVSGATRDHGLRVVTARIRQALEQPRIERTTSNPSRDDRRRIVHDGCQAPSAGQGNQVDAE